jgi:hypothetical protein
MKGISFIFIFVASVIILLVLIALPFGKQIALALGYLAELEPKYVQERLAGYITTAAITPGNITLGIPVNAALIFQVRLTDKDVHVTNITLPRTLITKNPPKDPTPFVSSGCSVSLPYSKFTQEAETATITGDASYTKGVSTIDITKSTGTLYFSLPAEGGDYRMYAYAWVTGESSAAVFWNVHDDTTNSWLTGNTGGLIRLLNMDTSSTKLEYSGDYPFHLLSDHKYSVAMKDFRAGAGTIHIDKFEFEPVLLVDSTENAKTITVNKNDEGGACKILLAVS